MPLLFVLISPPATLVMSWLLLKRNCKRWKSYFISLAVSLSFFLYHYEPINVNDMSRYYDMILKAGQMKFADIFSSSSDGLISTNVLFYIIGKIGIPQLLPMVVVAVSYGAMFYITCDVAAQIKSENKIYKVIIIQMILMSMFDLAIIARSSIAYSLMLLTLYLDLVKKKNKYLLFILYMVAAFFHTSAIFFLFIRFIIAFIKSIHMRLALSLMAILIVSLLSKKELTFGNTYIDTFFLKVNAYLNENGSKWWSEYLSSNIPFQVYKYIIFIIVLAFIYFIYVQIYINRSIKTDTFEYCNFCLYLALFTIIAGYIFPSNEFVRFYNALLIGSGSFLIPVFSGKYKYNGQKLLLTKLILLFGAIITKVYYIHIDNQSVDWIVMIEGYFINNGISLINMMINH